MLAGRPVIYTTFLAYDEVAHHSGIERPDALAVLRKVDHQIARVAAAADDAARPYRLIILSDHGQSQGATFRQRYGVTLEELVRSASEAGDLRAEDTGQDDAAAYLGAGLTELARDETMGAPAARRARPELETPQQPDVPDMSVMASGNLGLISLRASRAGSAWSASRSYIHACSRR